MFRYFIIMQPTIQIFEGGIQVIIKFQKWIFLLWFTDCVESLCCGWCKFFLFIPSFRNSSGESLGKCLLVFHNNYLWFWPFFLFSSFKQEFRMVSSCKKNQKSNLPPSFCLCGLGTRFRPGQAWCFGRDEALPQLGLQLCLFAWRLYKTQGKSMNI